MTLLKRMLFLLTFLAITMLFITSFILKETEIDKSEIPTYLDNHHIIKAVCNLSFNSEKNVNDKYLVLLSYYKKGSIDKYIGLVVFKILTNNKYKFEKYYESNQDIGINTIATKKNENTFNYAIFYGAVNDSLPSKYKINSNGKDYIEEIIKNAFFIKSYEIKDANGVNIIPINENIRQ